MRYPAFIAEVGSEAARPRLWFSIWSGYVMAASFGALAIAVQAFGVMPWMWQLHALIVGKLAINTLAWIALRRGRLVLELAGLNTLADIVVMTGGIYYTGGQLSPLLSIYIIEISVVALLTNVGVTLLAAGLMLFSYAAMALLVHTGVLAAYPPPAVTAGGLTDGYVAVHLAFAAFVIIAPTVYTSRVLHLLRSKERALEARSAELIEAGKQKSQFLANVTHELRTPIHAVCGLSDLVVSGVYGAVNDRQRAAHDGIKRSALGLLQLIDDLLQLSRADAGKLEVRPVPLDVGEVVEAVVASVRWMLGTKRTLLDVELEPGLPEVTTDRGKLSQILINLIANAVKFTPEEGRITVRVRGEGSAVAIAVEDTGIGIPEEMREIIFEEFRQVDGSNERDYGGVGLGLALVHRLAGLLHGRVTVESVVGRGSTFIVRLPVEWR